MISYLKGPVINITGTTVNIVLAGTIGYEVEVGPAVHKFAVGHEVTVYIWHHVSEASQTLFGFLEKEGPEVAKIVAKTDGIGPTMASRIIQTHGVKGAIDASRGTDPVAFAKPVPRLGKTKAEAVLAMLKKEVFDITAPAVDARGAAAKLLATTLFNLGFKEFDQDIFSLLWDKHHADPEPNWVGLYLDYRRSHPRA